MATTDRSRRISEIDRPLSSGEAAAILGLTYKSLTRYAEQGAIPFMTLPSGHRRFRKSDVEALLTKGGAFPSYDDLKGI
jgi:excisionase family DNA binding protein